MELVVSSGVFRNTFNQTRSKKLQLPHICYQIEEEIVCFLFFFFDCQFLFVFETDPFVWTGQGKFSFE